MSITETAFQGALVFVGCRLEVGMKLKPQPDKVKKKKNWKGQEFHLHGATMCEFVAPCVS